VAENLLAIADDRSGFNVLPDTPEIREAVGFIINAPKEAEDNETRERLAHYWAILRAEIHQDIERPRFAQQWHLPLTEQAEGSRRQERYIHTHTDVDCLRT
jgi:hypothetical protein